MDCSELTILNSHTEQNWNDFLLVRRGFYRRIDVTGLVERDHVGILDHERRL